VILEDAAGVGPDPCEWHSYGIEWTVGRCSFSVDSQTVLETPLSPRGPLGLVIWIDNQFAAFDPQGNIGWGVESNRSEQWLEVEDLVMEAPPSGEAGEPDQVSGK
jgi:hypothetical protein